MRSLHDESVLVLLHPPQFRSRRQVATSGGEFRNFTFLELIDSTSCKSLAVALARRHDTSCASLARCAELGDINTCESLARCAELGDIDCV